MGSDIETTVQRHSGELDVIKTSYDHDEAYRRELLSSHLDTRQANTPVEVADAQTAREGWSPKGDSLQAVGSWAVKAQSSPTRANNRVTPVTSAAAEVRPLTASLQAGCKKMRPGWPSSK